MNLGPMLSEKSQQRLAAKYIIVERRVGANELEEERKYFRFRENTRKKKN